MSTEDTTGDMEAGGGSRWSRATQDLSGEWALKGCREIEFEGRRVPTLRGIALLARIGKGGMGVVYFGVHPLLRTEVAVKVLPAALLQQREVLVDRFVREAQLAAGLQSDHLVAVRDVGHDNASGCYFIVMEFVRGVSAGAWADGDGRPSGDVPEADALDICIAATKGLSAAHVAGVVHRDIKPDNILLPCDDRGRARCGEAKLADLGLARAEMGGEGLTGKDVAMGTPGYMAPEQVIDARDARKPADVFGIGATLYSLLANQAPFKGKSASDSLVRTATGKYPGLRTLRADVSPAIEMVVDRCLRRKPEERFPDAPALLDALRICRQAIRESGPALGLDDISTQVVAIAKRRERGRKAISTAPPAATVVDDAETGETSLPSDDTPPLPPPLTDATLAAPPSEPPILDTPIPEPPTSEPEFAPPPSRPPTPLPARRPSTPPPVSRPPTPPPASRPPTPPPVSQPPPPAEPVAPDPLSLPPGASSFGDATQSIALRALDMVGVSEPAKMPEPKKKGGGLKIAAAVLIPVALIAALAVWWSGRDPPEPTPDPEPPPVEPAPAATGGLNVTSKPSGATVFVAGKQRGTTPLRVAELAAGRYVVRVEAPFFGAKEWTDVEVRAGKSKALHGDLDRGQGRVVLAGGPPAGTARLVRVGEPEAVIELPLDADGGLDRDDVDAGLYELTVSGDGFAPQRVPGTVRVDVGGTATVEPKMDALPATVTVKAEPAGVQILIDGELIGTVPIERHVVSPGAHRITLELDEHEPQRLPFTVRAGQNTTVTGIRLVPWAKLDLSALAEGETAWIGEERVLDGQRVPPGETVLVVRREGYADQTVGLAARVGTRLRVELDPWEPLGATLDLSELASAVTAYMNGNPVSGVLRLANQSRVTIELRRDGYESQTHDVELLPGKTARVWPREWTVAAYAVDLTRLQRGVVAEFEGRALRNGELLRGGTHTVRLRLAGHDDQVVQLTVPNSGRTAVVTAARWVQQPGTLDTSRLDADVVVLVDGRAVRHGGRLSPGRHRVTLRRPGYVDQQIPVAHVSAGGTLRLDAAPWRTAAATPAEAQRLLTDITRWDSASPDARRQAAEAVGAATQGFRFTGIKRFSAGGVTHDVGVFLHESTGLEFSLIPAGRFRMGSPGSEAYRDADEVPHTVTLTRPFLMCRTEVPNKVWAKFGGGGGQGAENDPATNMTWPAAIGFCKATGLRLPTEAQWEYACRAGTRGTYAFGTTDASVGDYAWFLDNSGHRTHGVGQKRPNAFGLFDMHGNVWEWCRDGYDRYPSGDVTNPMGDPDPRFRVFRGGNCRSKSESLRSAQRASRRPSYKDAGLGLRPSADVRLK